MKLLHVAVGAGGLWQIQPCGLLTKASEAIDNKKTVSLDELQICTTKVQHRLKPALVAYFVAMSCIGTLSQNVV